MTYSASEWEKILQDNTPNKVFKVSGLSCDPDIPGAIARNVEIPPGAKFTSIPFLPKLTKAGAWGPSLVRVEFHPPDVDRARQAYSLWTTLLYARLEPWGA